LAPQDFDCGIADIAEITDGHDIDSYDTGSVSTKHRIVNAIAQRSTNPTLDEGVMKHIAPEHDVDFDDRTVVSSYVPLIRVLLAEMA
jgi:hypothetical protein